MSRALFRFFWIHAIISVALLSAETEDSVKADDRIALLEARLVELEARLAATEENEGRAKDDREARIAELEGRLAEAEKKAEQAATDFSIGGIVVNDVLSFEGFVDMSYSHLDQKLKFGDSPDISESDNRFRVDEVEIAWLFDFEPITARIEIEHEENGDSLEVEQAFVVYQPDSKLEGSSFIAGRYASMLGFEDFEKPGLYQFTTAYGNVFSGYVAAMIGSGSTSEIFADSEIANFFDAAFFPVGERYSQGVKYTFEDEATFLGVSLQDGTINYGNRLGGDNGADGTAVDGGGYGFEIAYAYSFRTGVNFFLGGSYETGDGVRYSDSGSGFTLTTGDTETYITNTYLTYELGAWLFAVELNYSETGLDDFNSGSDADIESITGLIMTNYAYSENASVTGRISYMDAELDAGSAFAAESKAFKYTIAHNYVFMNNIILIGEVSYTDGDVEGSSADFDTEELFAGVGLIFVF